MQRLELDFVRHRPAPPWAGRLLLAIALAFAADVGYSFVKTQQAFTAHKALLAKLEPRGAKKARIAPEELAAARDTVQRLSMPWDNLFSALEHAASDQVALLSIEPDPKAGTVVISGDSKDYLAALSYVLNLSREDKLSRVQLLRHELKKGDPQRPVGFAVSAAWAEARK
jgi:hypothetical protein